MMTISELMIRLKELGCKSTAFFFNTGINQWQFTACEANRNYSYGYGETPEEAAMDALTNLEKGTPRRDIKLKPDEPSVEDLF